MKLRPPAVFTDESATQPAEMQKGRVFMKFSKKSLSLALGLLLTFSLCTPALAADSTMDQELAQVTQTVKKTVSVDSDYEKFSGTLNDMGALRNWQLQWSSSNGKSLNILATSAGKIMQYNLDRGVSDTSTGSYKPSIAKISPDQAKKSAAAFFKKTAGSGESIETPDCTDTVSFDGTYSLQAQLLLQGVPSGIQMQFSVSAADGVVTSYSRSDANAAFVNQLPSSKPAVSAADAAKTLNSTVQLELQYVSDGGKAILRYLPVSTDAFYVDAQTGKLVDLTEAWNSLRSGVAGIGGVNATTAADKENSLTPAENAAIQKLKGVQSKEQLDTAVRAVSALGLNRYTLGTANYAQNSDNDEITCTLIYKRTLALSELTGVTAEQYGDGSGYQQVKLITVNAKTAALLSGWSWSSGAAKSQKADPAALQPAAEAFLKIYAPTRVGHVALASSTTDGSFCFDRKENGYFYHGNSVTVTIDPADGSVSNFGVNWEDDLKFQPAGTPVSAQAAMDAYCAAFTAKLQYISHPVSVDVTVPIWKTYADCCGTIAYRYVLGYQNETDGDAVLGVDAATGKVVRDTQSAPLPYTDIARTSAKAKIQALADSGIRFNDTAYFLPGAKLTQQDMLVFLLNADNYHFSTTDLSDKDTLDQLYAAAWEKGFLPRGQKHPTQTVTRLDLVRAIVSASPYGPAAKLKGIFTTSFKDAAQVKSADLGYLAIAQGLGLAYGSGGKFYPSRTATRAEAAVMLYNYMSR